MEVWGYGGNHVTRRHGDAGTRGKGSPESMGQSPETRVQRKGRALRAVQSAKYRGKQGRLLFVIPEIAPEARLSGIQWFKGRAKGEKSRPESIHLHQGYGGQAACQP